MLIRKMLRDIYKNKVQFTVIFLMMFIGCFLFSGITGEWKGLEKIFNNYIHNQNMADIWVFHHFSETNLEQIRKDDRITEAEGRMFLPMVPADNREASLDTYVAESDNISRLHVKEGIPFDSSQKGIWLDALYAKENHYKVGSYMELQYKGLEIKGKILSLVYSPEYIWCIRRRDDAGT